MQTLDDAISRLEQMARPDSSGTWDLSPNDISAINRVLAERTLLRGTLRTIAELDYAFGDRMKTLAIAALEE